METPEEYRVGGIGFADYKGYNSDRKYRESTNIW